MKAATETKFKQTEIGMIPEEWDFDELGKRARIIMGQSPESSFYNSNGSGTVFLQGIRTFGGLFPKYDTWTTKVTKLAKRGSVLLSVRAPVGEVNFADRNVCIGRGLMSIDGGNNQFIFYSFKAHKDYVTGRETGTVYGAVTRDDIAKIRFPFPDSSEQAAITRILWTFDSKIELNKQMNKILEAIAKAIFKRWFVDFEFPNEEGKPYKSSGGEMVYNEDAEQEIPKEWKVKRFAEAVYVNPRRELGRETKARKVGMADLNTWQASIESWTYEEYKSGPRFKNGDTLFARITPSLEHGKTAYVSILENEEVGFGSTEFIVLGKKVITSELYVFHLSRSEAIRSAAIGAMTGTSGRQRVPNDLFDELPIVVPPLELVHKFDEVVGPQFNRISRNTKQIKILAEIRDLLLPKLVSGKIRVPVEVR